MQKMNLFKSLRRWHWHKQSSSSIRSCDFSPRSFGRLWSSFRHRSFSSFSSSSSSQWDSSESGVDDENGNSTPQDVPAGCLVVYVGTERRRFVIGAHCLNHPLFKAMLERSAEEYGFHHQGGLTIACEVVMFQHLLRIVAHDDPSSRCSEIENLVDDTSSEALNRPLL